MLDARASDCAGVPVSASVRTLREELAAGSMREDLYADGQPTGQVGQEIHGAGAASVFASRAFHGVEGAPLRTPMRSTADTGRRHDRSASGARCGFMRA